MVGTTFQEGKPWLQYLWLLTKPLLATFLLMSHWPEGEGNGNPLQYSCIENPMDRGAWWAAVHRVAHSWTWLKWLSMLACFREGNGNPLQYSCLENPRDRGAWWAAVYEVTQNQTRWKWLSSSSSSSIGQRRSLAKLSVHVRGSYIRMWVLWDVIHWLLHPWGH